MISLDKTSALCFSFMNSHDGDGTSFLITTYNNILANAETDNSCNSTGFSPACLTKTSFTT
jgi:hypothetical protein